MNPFRDLPWIPAGQQILDVAFNRASKVRPKISKRTRDRVLKARIIETSKLESASETITDQLFKIVRGFPSLDSVEQFYKEIADIVVGLDKLRNALGALDGYRQVIRTLARDHIRRMRSAKEVMEIKSIRRTAYGRISSILEKAAGRLDLIASAREKLRKIVSIDVDRPTVVVAGAPNVGKSSLVRAISSAKPEVADYPFTTRSLIIGHLVHDKKKIQVIDTPGLLDRPISKRNPLELQAIAALRHLGKMVIFLFDPTETCGYTLKTQLGVLSDIRDLFKEAHILIAINKIDLASPEQIQVMREAIPDGIKAVEISATTRKGIEMLTDSMLNDLESL